MSPLGKRQKRLVRHPRTVLFFFGLLGTGCLLLFIFGCFPSGSQEEVKGNAGLTASQLHEAQSVRDEILEQVRKKESLSAREISVLQEELNNALSDGKLHIQTATHVSSLTETVSEFLRDEKGKGDDVLIWSGYLGLLGESWGALLKTPEGVEIVTFSESLTTKEGESISEHQAIQNSDLTFEERAALLQSDWL